MKRLTLFFIFTFNTSFCFAQEVIPTKQFMLGCTNVGPTEAVTHHIEAIGAAWEKSSGVFVISTNALVYDNSVVTTGNADFTSNDWPGFNFIWLDAGLEMPRWGLGLYKVTNFYQTDQTDKYFYLDARDSDFGGNAYLPDFFIYFNNSDGIYYHRYTNDPIPQASVVRIWDIHNEEPNVSGLQNYWNHALVMTNNGNNKPRVVWGPHPSFTTTHYHIFRAVAELPLNPKVPLNYYIVGIRDASTYEFTDIEFEIGGSEDYIAFYYVKAYNSETETYSSAT